MKNECSIVRDLLPLYAEDMVSDETKSFIDEHIKCCENCRNELEQIKKNNSNQQFNIEEPIKTLKNKLLKKRVMTIALTVLITLAAAIVIITSLTTPKYFPYSQNPISTTETESGTIIINISEQVANYDCNVVYDSDTGKNLYFIEAWTTPLEKLINSNKTRPHNFEINDKNCLIFYSPNNGEYDVLIHGEAPENFGNIQTLPRLVLNYYFIIAIVLFVILIIIGAISEKKFGRTAFVNIINIIIPIPASYAIAHVCTMISGWSAYSHGRYFIANLSLTVIIFFINRLILNILALKKETKQINQ